MYQARIIKALLLLVCTGFSNILLAQNFCFTLADTYYEQVYCELQARGEASSLPPLHEFKRSNATTQALLLRRPATRLGIDLPMPTQAKAKSVSEEPRRPVAARSETKESAVTVIDTELVNTLSNCQLADQQVHCPDRRYQLLTNLNNRQLVPDALSSDNRMALPTFTGDPSDERAVNNYLHRAYERYIEQMLAIGLGGATMSYGKFAFLFDDLRGKGLDFSQRFETMYDFLKRDKASMAVSERLSVDETLAIEHCDMLSETLLVCSRAGGRNFVFKAL